MHVLIVGNSYSGKSNLAKSIAADLAARGENITIYDPMKSRGWPEGAVKYADPGKFLDAMEGFENTAVFVDEAKTLWDYDMPKANRLLYLKRHDGVLVFLIAQRTKMVPPNARNQCSRIFAFKQQTEDAKILAAEYDEILIETRQLKEAHFIVSNGFENERRRLDYSNGVPPKNILL